MINFDDIHLLREEKRSLFSFHFHKKQRQEEIECFQSLFYEYGFIRENFTKQHDREGRLISEDTYSISDQYRRYKIYRREKRIHDLPNWVAITISLIGLIGNTLIELWRLGLL